MTLASQTDDEIEGYYNEISSAFNKAIETLHKAGKYDPKMLEDGNGAELIRKISSVLAKPLDNIELKRKIPQELSSALRENVFIFSGFKTARELDEASALLRDDDGNTKPFGTFYNDVKSIDVTYNRNYLYAEYNYATSSCQMAVKWKDWEQDGDDYDLQYRTANDDRVREEHQELDGITLPPSDPFWRSYLPPNGWNCRCTAVQVRKGKYPESDSEDAIRKGDAITSSPKQRMFRFNPGIQLKVFPDKHPYFPKGCGNCNRSMLSYDPNSDRCKECKAIESLSKKNSKPINYKDNKAEFKELRNNSKKHNKELSTGMIENKNYYTTRIKLSNDAIDALYAHTFDTDEINAVENIRDIIKEVKNGKYEAIKTSRPNYKEKLTRWNVRHFVRYEIELDGISYLFKTEAIRYEKEGKYYVYEKPYSIKKKKGD